MTQEEIISKAPIKKAVAKMAIPSVISSLVTVIYNMADTFFVGQTGDSIQVAAVSLTNPCFILMMAMSNILGMGGSALISKFLGEKNSKKAGNASAFAFYGSIAVGLLLMAILLIFTNPILQLFGADSSTLADARGYVIYIAIGAPFIIWSAAASFIVRATGASKEAMIGNIIGTVLNIVLDPIFISGFGMGAAGAAIATVIGNAVASIYYVWFFICKDKVLTIAPVALKLRSHMNLDMIVIGLPTGIFSALMSVSTIVLNQILLVYGNSAVAAIGIVFKANMFIAFFQMGIANGVQPLLGYAFGAGDRDRFIGVEKYTKKICIITGVLCTLLYFVLRSSIIQLFINDAEVIHYGVEMLVAYMLSGPFIGILFMNMNLLQSVGKPFPSLLLSIMRQGVVLIPLLLILRVTVGYYGVIAGQSISDYIAIICSIFWWNSCKKKIWKAREGL